MAKIFISHRRAGLALLIGAGLSAASALAGGAPVPEVPQPEPLLTEAEPATAPIGHPRLRVGEVFRDVFLTGRGAGPELVVLPPGRFIMGSPETEPGREAGEGPQREVEIGYLLAVGKYEVTWDEWSLCVADGACEAEFQSDHGFGRGRRPVIEVSWEHAQEYARWLSKRTGQPYRLLSEAEWEYAARAGSEGPWSFGEDMSQIGEYGWYSLNAESMTHPVGQKAPNAFGLYDMHGNVVEWVEDCWADSYEGAPVDGSAWTEGDCTDRVMRGGSWRTNPRFLRSAFRFSTAWSFRHTHIGFRVARTL
ncbi:formylglycine-generating enzyme family protein [Hyphomonas sp.]|uniref:formylglycine-generating enzyme family protein n=1 Tax=Hyphomonas sp. TaxID=87 RepID=UPI00391C956B